MICAHVPQTIPDCLRVKYLHADARRTLARLNARPSCARMSPVDACSLLRAHDLRACAPDYPRLPARQVSTRRCAACPCAHEGAPVMRAYAAGRCLCPWFARMCSRLSQTACASSIYAHICAAYPCAHECAPVMRAHCLPWLHGSGMKWRIVALNVHVLLRSVAHQRSMQIIDYSDILLSASFCDAATSR